MSDDQQDQPKYSTLDTEVFIAWIGSNAIAPRFGVHIL